MTQRGLENATIPVGGSLWRALGQNGMLAIGYGLVTVHAVVLLADGFVFSRGDYDTAELWGLITRWSTILCPLFATCFLIMGELVRRGDWRGQSRHKPDAALPQGTNTVALRMLPMGWHVLWGLFALGVAALVVLLVATGTDDDRIAIWMVNGIMAAAIVGLVLASGVKKRSWARGGAQRAREVEAVHPALQRRGVGRTRSRTFWRWFGFRWRFDLVTCALATVGLWLGVLMLGTRSTFESSADSTTAVAAVLLPFSVVLLAVGLWTTTQFWRSGEDLAMHESVA